MCICVILNVNTHLKLEVIASKFYFIVAVVSSVTGMSFRLTNFLLCFVCRICEHFSLCSPRFCVLGLQYASLANQFFSDKNVKRLIKTPEVMKSDFCSLFLPSHKLASFTVLTASAFQCKR